MKKAKSISQRTKAVESDHISVHMLDAKTLQELDYERRNKAYAIFGAIKQLATIHNTLVDQRPLVSNGNQVVVTNAMNLLEKAIDHRLDRMNDYISDSLDDARRANRVLSAMKRSIGRKNAKKKTSSKSRRKDA